MYFGTEDADYLSMYIHMDTNDYPSQEANVTIELLNRKDDAKTEKNGMVVLLRSAAAIYVHSLFF